MPLVGENLGPQEADMLVRDGESKCWTTALSSTGVGSWDPQLNVTQAQLLLIIIFFFYCFFGTVLGSQQN